MTRSWIVVAGACTWLTVSSCSTDTGTVNRYALERQLYDATRAEIHAFEAFPVDDFAAWKSAVRAYENVLANNPTRDQAGTGPWNASVAADIRRVALSANLGLLRLWFFDFRQHAAVTNSDYWYEPRERIRRLPGNHGNLELDTLYHELGAADARTVCERLVRRVAVDSVFWSSVDNAADTVLAVPLALLGRRHRSSDLMGLADGFYTRVVARWPTSRAARRALAYRAATKTTAGRYAEAIADLDTLLQQNRRVWGTDEILVMKGDALVHGLGLVDSGVAVYNDAMKNPTSDDTRWAARLRIAFVASMDREGEPGTDVELKRCHLDQRAPEWAAAWAAWARAKFQYDHGDWDRAADLMWRLTQRHPYTIPGLLAPLVVARAAAGRGSAAEVKTARDKSVEYYDRIMSRPSAALVPRYYVVDCLFELQRIITAGGFEFPTVDESNWREDFREIAAFKRVVLGRGTAEMTREDFKRLLSVMERSDRSRYARAIERTLDALQSDAKRTGSE